MRHFGLDDALAIEGEETDSDPFEAVQRAINSLTAWRMQGSYGRAMMNMIQSGQALLGHEDTRDYYGNHIPSRHQVEEGTIGSYEYVANLSGREWADRMAAL